MNISRWIYKVTVAGALAMTGCAYQQAARVETPAQEFTQPRPVEDYSRGSLWQAGSVGLAQDLKARRPGDILTVVIVESASASKKAATDTKTSSAMSAGMPNLFGLETSMTGLKNWMDLARLVDMSGSKQFGGSGSTSRQEQLMATISCRVVEVAGNGNLRIRGERNIMVNNEEQIIVLTGVVRARDIAGDNTVSSSAIADANISYTGKGLVSEQQGPGWLSRLVGYLWPF